MLSERETLIMYHTFVTSNHDPVTTAISLHRTGKQASVDDATLLEQNLVSVMDGLIWLSRQPPMCTSELDVIIKEILAWPSDRTIAIQ